jgi:hypothetical protein
LYPGLRKTIEREVGRAKELSATRYIVADHEKYSNRYWWKISAACEEIVEMLQ